MGLRHWLGLTEAAAPSVEASVLATDPGTQRALLTLADYSVSQLPITIGRNEALRVPALNNGVRILCGIAGQLPLVCTPSEEPKAFLDELDPTVTRGWTVAKTVEDLILYNVAWWRVTGRNARQFPRTVQRVDPTRVMVDMQTGEVRIDGQEIPNDDIKRFDGIGEGLLVAGADAIRTALANVQQARVYAEHPAPQRIYTDADGVDASDRLTPEEARSYMTAANDTIRLHGEAYMAGMKVTQVGWSASEIQLIEARQQDAVEMARLLAIPTRYVAAPAQGDSLTYANLGEVRRDLIDVGGLSSYMVPIEQRLSMPDMTPAGSTVKFDAESYFLRITPDEAVQDLTSPASQTTDTAGVTV